MNVKVQMPKKKEEAKKAAVVEEKKADEAENVWSIDQ